MTPTRRNANMMQIMNKTEQDLIEQVEKGEVILTPPCSVQRFCKLMSRLALSVADTELALSSAFADHINSTNDLKQRIDLARLIQEKLSIAQRIYEMLEGFGFHVDQYMAEIKLLDSSNCQNCNQVGLSALKYPLVTWADVGAATFLVSTAIALEFEGARSSSYQPWINCATESLALEGRSIEAALGIIGSFRRTAEQREVMQQSLSSWYSRIRACYSTWLLDEETALSLGIRKSLSAVMVENWTNKCRRELATLGFQL